jgi:hypothetical protein
MNKKNEHKTVGILNFQWYDNFGAVLLAYAMQQALLDITTDVEIIDYVKRKHNIRKNGFDFGTKKIYFLLNKVIRYCLKQTIKIDGSRLSILLSERKQKYENFRNLFLKRTCPIDTTDCKSFLKFTHYIVGSDVVWSPEILTSTNADIYFLKPTPKNATKISYAASIGTDDPVVLKKLSLEYKTMLADFDFISTREKESVIYIQELVEGVVRSHIDPVFLLNSTRYQELLKCDTKTRPPKYIYLYMIPYNSELVSFAKKLSKELSLPLLINIKPENVIYAKKKAKFDLSSMIHVSDGPIEFLGNISNAEYVLTNSFHGTAFSIIFHKEFYTFEAIKKGRDISVRMKNLLSQIGLTDRFFSNQPMSLMNSIDYSMVDEIINMLRKEAISYFDTCIAYHK